MRRMFLAMPLTLQCLGGAARIAGQVAQLAPLFVGLLRRPAGVPPFEQANQAKLVPTPAPVLDAVAVHLEVIGHLLQRQTCASPNILCAPRWVQSVAFLLCSRGDGRN
jgi:hypothetical protein